MIALNAAAAFENFDNNLDCHNTNHEILLNNSSDQLPSLNINDLPLLKTPKLSQRMIRRPQQIIKKNEEDDTTAESSACLSDTKIGKAIKRRKKIKVNIFIIQFFNIIIIL